MSLTIVVLDETTANKIAAGEVVERPASVVKELVENSIDANSTNIEIEITDGGASRIRVTDNGFGMSPEDARLAILRHATSKIRTVEDIYNIASLGFRGEALPSIAAVSRFALTTRQHDSPLATYVQVTGGTVDDISEAGAGPGTTITVGDLFFNTPARKKFLKSVSSESGHIHDIIAKLALVRADISFKLINNGRIVLATPGTGQLADAAASLYGPQTAAELLAVAHEQDGIAISGFIGKPTVLKSSRSWQTFSVNRRVVSSRMLSKALDNAYHSLLPKTGYPLAILYVSLAPATIDVNVHPQKSEVKFSDEQTVFRAVYRAVVNALTGAQSPATLATSAISAVPANYDRVGQQSTDERPPISSSFRRPPVGEYQGATVPGLAGVQPVQLWQEAAVPLSVARVAMVEQDHLSGLPSEPAAPSIDGNLSLRPLGQVEDCYIVAQSPDGLFIVDQHAAHERILYDRFRERAGTIPAQQLLVPLLLELDDSDIQLMQDHGATWAELGFSLDQAGPGLIRITELPADVPQSDAPGMIREIVTALRNHRQPSAGELRHAILQIASCRGAVKAGDILNMRQMQVLLSELCGTTLPFTCPHGRPAMIRFSPGELAKMFKRT